MKAARLEVDRAVKDYNKSKNFKLEVIEGCIDSYHLRFSDCKKKVTQAFSSLDVKDIVESDEESENEEDDEGVEADRGARKPVEVRVGQADIVAAQRMVTKEGAMKEIIAKAVVSTGTMIVEAVKSQDPIQQDVCDEEEQIQESFFIFTFCNWAGAQFCNDFLKYQWKYAFFILVSNLFEQCLLNISSDVVRVCL